MRMAVIAVVGALAAVVGGCSVARVEQASPDAAAAWSAVPLPPDPALAAQAIAEGSTCRDIENPEPVEVLIQDRRTERTAAFLVAGPTTFGSCLISKGDFSTGGSGPIPDPMSGPLTIDAFGSGGSETFKTRELGGRVANNASTITIELEDGTSFGASLLNGYWLAWWPEGVRAVRVVARDAAGATVGDLEVPR